MHRSVVYSLKGALVLVYSLQLFPVREFAVYIQLRAVEQTSARDTTNTVPTVLITIVPRCAPHMNIEEVDLLGSSDVNTASDFEKPVGSPLVPIQKLKKANTLFIRNAVEKQGR